MNEFNTEYVVSLCSPALFPDKKSDSTNSSILRDVSKSETESSAEKNKHLVNFGEKAYDKWVCRFASHPRCGFLACNILHRRLLLGSFKAKSR